MMKKHSKKARLTLSQSPYDDLTVDVLSDNGTKAETPETPGIILGSHETKSEFDLPWKAPEMSVGSFMQSTPRQSNPHSNLSLASPTMIESFEEKFAKDTKMESKMESKIDSFRAPKIQAWLNPESERKERRNCPTPPLDEVVYFEALEEEPDINRVVPVHATNRSIKRSPKSRSPKNSNLSQEQKNEEWIEEDIA